MREVDAEPPGAVPRGGGGRPHQRPARPLRAPLQLAQPQLHRARHPRHRRSHLHRRDSLRPRQQETTEGNETQVVEGPSETKRVGIVWLEW